MQSIFLVIQYRKSKKQAKLHRNPNKRKNKKMEIKANRKELIAAFKIANACIDNRASFPILANAHVEAKGNQIEITCTNLEHRITVTCTAEVNGTVFSFL